MSGYKFVEIGRDDRTGRTELYINDLQACLREADKREIIATGQEVRKGIRHSVFSSNLCYAVVADGGLFDVLAIFGLRKFNGENIAWCLATKRIERYKKSFARESRNILREWALHYGTLTNAVAVKNEKAVSWLKWVGATFGKPFELNGVEFMQFEYKGE